LIRGGIEAVGNTRPRRHPDVDAGLLRRLPGARVDGKRHRAAVVHVAVAREIRRLTDVHVLARLVLPEDVEDRLLDLFPRHRRLHPHEPHGGQEAVHVLLQPEDVQLLVRGVPVGRRPSKTDPPYFTAVDWTWMRASA
jgi:hypothetical protein